MKAGNGDGVGGEEAPNTGRARGHPVCVCVTLGIIGILSDCFSFTVVFLVQQGDWS